MKPVAKIVGVDEYGPIIEWTTHWVDLKGAELCVVEQAARATPADHSRDSVIEACAKVCDVLGVDDSVSGRADEGAEAARGCADAIRALASGTGEAT